MALLFRSIARARREDQVRYRALLNQPAIPPIAIDGHMHIMSSHTTPLPLIWDKVPGSFTARVWQPSTATLDWISRRGAYTWFLGRLGEIGQRRTVDIGTMACRENSAAYDRLEYPGGDGFTCLVFLPMDMDYAHYAGLDGYQIYFRASQRDSVTEATHAGIGSSSVTWHLPPRASHVVTQVDERYAGGRALPAHLQHEFDAIRQREEARTSTWFTSRAISTDTRPRYFALALDTDGATGAPRRSVVWLAPDEMSTFEPYPKQLKDTRLAALKHPTQLLPLYHYEPRRWNGRRQAFRDDIATAGRPGVFIGIKMYPSLGYRPADWDRIKGLREFYGFCEQHGIPIMTHCSPEGMYTHERASFLALDGAAAAAGIPGKAIYEAEQKKLKRFEQSWEEFYFSERYVSPTAWEEVLAAFPKLRLCLAHFGSDDHGFSTWGKNAERHRNYDRAIEPWDERIISLVRRYEHCYVDMSYLFLWDNRERLKQLLLDEDDDDALKNKIVFGTDWYMIENDRTSYAAFYDRTRQLLKDLSRTGQDYRHLWVRFCCLNPLEFYQLKAVLPRFAEGLKAELSRTPKGWLKRHRIDPAEVRRVLDEKTQLLDSIDVERFADFINYRRR